MAVENWGSSAAGVFLISALQGVRPVWGTFARRRVAVLPGRPVMEGGWGCGGGGGWGRGAGVFGRGLVGGGGARGTWRKLAVGGTPWVRCPRTGAGGPRRRLPARPNAGLARCGPGARTGRCLAGAGPRRLMSGPLPDPEHGRPEEQVGPPFADRAGAGGRGRPPCRG